MANITLRQGSGNTEPRLASANVKNAPLTNTEVDNNFNNLNNDINNKVNRNGDSRFTGDLSVVGSFSSDAVFANNFTQLGETYSSLHRSPNAITAMYIYDTSKDSDGGAWTEKCQHTSWYNETIYGKWLGAQNSLSAASAAMTSSTDYYQLTTDGKFYTQYNLLTYTEDFSNSAWQGGLNGSSLSVGGLLVPNTSLTNHYTSRSFTTEARDYTLTIEAKASGYNFIALMNATQSRARTFNLSNGTKGGVAGQIAPPADSITSLGDGWYRCSITVSCTAAAQSWRFYVFNTDGSAAWAGDGVSGVQIRYSQLVASPNTLPYQKVVTGSELEVFRGNKRSFPKLAAIVGEKVGSLGALPQTAYLTIYDLTEPGRPMWMRFSGTSGMLPHGSNHSYYNGYTSITALNGVLAAGNSDATLRVIKWMADLGGNGQFLFNGNIAQRNASMGFVAPPTGFWAYGGGSPSALAVSVLNNADIDLQTTLPRVTIANASHLGVSLSNGRTILFSSNTSAFTQVTLTPQLLSAGRADTTWYYAANPGSLGASFALSTKNASTATDFNVGNTTLLKDKDRSNYARTSGAVVQLLRNNEGTIGKGIAAKLSDTYNTGWLAGDIRRAYLASNVAGSVTAGPELVTNGTFDTDTTGWTALVSTISVVSGVLRVTENGSVSNPIVQQSFIVTPGRLYKVTFDLVTLSMPRIRVWVGSTYGTANWLNSADITTTGTKTAYFTALGSTAYFEFVGYCTAGGTTEFFAVDNVSVTEVIPDRSYKAAGANITGTLTATAVNTGNDLVAYSGFSANNYIREPYSADLDFGTNEWSISSWINVSSNNANSGTILSREYSSGPYIKLGIDANNKVVITANDSVTTLSATSTISVNNNKWIKVRSNYARGNLSLIINRSLNSSSASVPLLSANNANAVFTIGNSYDLTAPFPGSIAFVKMSATVPTNEQSTFMYEQEKELFRANTKCVLPASTSVLDLSYDDKTDTWTTVQAGQESTWSGLVRTANSAPTSGLFGKVATQSGIKLSTRSGNVDITIANTSIYSKLNTVDSSNKDIFTFDYDTIGFAANTRTSNNILTDVVINSGSPYVGMGISGTGVANGTTITAILSNTYYLSANTTANGRVSIGQTTFDLPQKYTASSVSYDGYLAREGTTKDYTRSYDGFKETIVFAVSPGANAWVQIYASKE